jgi:hypothetical protein
MKNTMIAAAILTGVSMGCVEGQPPPPPPDAQAQPGALNQAQPGTLNTVSGTISQFNYGPEGRVEGLVLGQNTLAFLPPDWAMQLETTAKVGDSVRITGLATPLPTGMQSVDVQSISIGGRNLSVLQPTQPSPYAGTGAVRQLNYDRSGAVNGFVLDNGMIARTPPFGASDVSAIKPGVQIALSGFARTTAAGKTVVDVQSITVNGQTISMNAGPPGPPPVPPAGPEPGPRGGRGAAPGPPPPPPPSGGRGGLQQ